MTIEVSFSFNTSNFKMTEENKPKALFNWSSGKDSAFALYKTFQENKLEVVTLLTSVSEEFERISMHGVRVALLEQQAQSIGLPVTRMMLPKDVSMDGYRDIVGNKMKEMQELGVTHSIFGDIFLEDLRKYREDQLNSIGMQAVFPLWKIDTKQLIRDFIDLGFKTIVTCVNGSKLDKSFAGRIIDHQFLDDLPESVDQCGENGEFHTFTFDGPIFKHPIEFDIGEVVSKSYPKPKSTSNTCSTAITKPSTTDSTTTDATTTDSTTTDSTTSTTDSTTCKVPKNGDEKSNEDCRCCDDFKYVFWFCDLIPKEGTNKE
ncbi:hypothetical protein PPL_07193 [Heterostelium album PN500]|uniref:Diphthine--ammonia ligase n=1 Tax=Heterostelium pallidum (strain ATCC 26659 / Pp 5 / PN500) TaxID=670386 RepID=D3BEM9_HETP5|nr:hypothetical protein PPL_07193 [Heterostelium album PN500]EFA80360.1 hypothetical protein PPL_07193 [Heterostelium album PN500]|eukprot:XP_020432480.1 hypothetical protein PPL_07193 [Heterostelium album PN500]